MSRHELLLSENELKKDKPTKLYRNHTDDKSLV